MNKKEAESILPSEPTQSIINPSSLCIFIIAEPKWGKTHFFMSNPNAVLLAFEDGHKFQRGYKLIIDKWHSKGRYDIKKDKEGCPHMTAMQAVDVLENTDKFDFVIMDTTDMAVKMCSDYHCEAGGAKHPTDLGDFGKGWDTAINTPFRKFMMRILKTGRGLGLISHSKTEVSRFTSGERARKEATLSGGPMKMCASQADLIMHGEYGRKQAGHRLRDRVLVCEGDSDTMAGNRSGTMMPSRYIVSPKNPWKQFQTFFTDPDAAGKAEAKYQASLKGGKSK